MQKLVGIISILCTAQGIPLSLTQQISAELSIPVNVIAMQLSNENNPIIVSDDAATLIDVCMSFFLIPEKLADKLNLK